MDMVGPLRPASTRFDQLDASISKITLRSVMRFDQLHTPISKVNTFRIFTEKIIIIVCFQRARIASHSSLPFGIPFSATSNASRPIVPLQIPQILIFNSW